MRLPDDNIHFELLTDGAKYFEQPAAKERQQIFVRDFHVYDQTCWMGILRNH